MNKDALVATGIGFGVGLVVTGLILYGPTIGKNITFPKFPSIHISLPNFNAKKPSPTPTPTVAVKDNLTIESPLPESLEQNEKVLVSGTTTKGATVIIGTDTDEIILVANDTGAYAGKVTLSEGKNIITVVRIAKDLPSLTQTVTAYYTPEEF